MRFFSIAVVMVLAFSVSADDRQFEKQVKAAGFEVRSDGRLTIHEDWSKDWNKDVLKWAEGMTGSPPNITVELHHARDGRTLIKEVWVKSYDWHRAGTKLNDVARTFEGKEFTLELLPGLAASMKAAYYAEYGEKDVEKTMKKILAGTAFELRYNRRGTIRTSDEWYKDWDEAVVRKADSWANFNRPHLYVDYSLAKDGKLYIKKIWSAADPWGAGYSAMEKTAKTFEGKEITTKFLQDFDKAMKAAYYQEFALKKK